MRYLVAVLGLLAVIAGLAGVKYKQISSLITMGDEMKKSGPPPEPVGSSIAAEQEWEATIAAVGTVTAVKGVTVSNEVPGTVTAIRFESGQTVKKGQVLLELDTSVERAQLASLQARLDYAELTASRSRALKEGSAVAEAQVDADEAQRKATSRDVAALQAQIDRKTTRAPFAGRLGLRTVNLGQYLQPGTATTTLEAIDAVYVDFSLPQQRLADVAVGTPVRVVVDGSADKATEGTIGAIDPGVDPATRSIKLRAAVPNHGEKLRPGMFADVTVVLPKRGPSVVVPAPAVVHASYGDSVFVIEPKKDADGKPVTGKDGAPALVARQQFVRTGESRGDFVAILDGVKVGERLVSAGAFKLRNGAGIVVDDTVQPRPELAPKPANR